MAGKADRSLKAFYDNLAQDHGDFVTYYSSHPVGVTRVAKILRMLALTPEDEVCDIGCGDGYIATQVRRTTQKVKGLDMSQVRARRAGTRGIGAVCADAASIPLKQEQFDKVICSEVIEHVIEPEAVLHEINRVLKTDGSAVLTVPLNEILDKTLLDVPDEELANQPWVQIGRRYKIANAHIRSFTEVSFQELVERCGFKVDETDYTYDHTLRQNVGIWSILKIWRALIARLGERIVRIPLGKSLIRLVLFTVYKKGSSKHHVIVRVTKC